MRLGFRCCSYSGLALQKEGNLTARYSYKALTITPPGLLVNKTHSYDYMY